MHLNWGVLNAVTHFESNASLYEHNCDRPNSGAQAEEVKWDNDNAYGDITSKNIVEHQRNA